MSDEEKNLDIMAKASNYNKWIFEQIEPHLGDKILEVGSGVGSMTAFFDNKKVCCVDVNDNHIKALQKKYKCHKNITVVKTDLSRNHHKIKDTFDTIICINILEHVEDDMNMLVNFYPLLKKKGKLILMLPAFKKLYGTIDEADNHYRRYNKKEIEQVLDIADFKIKDVYYMNIIGAIGWYYHGKMLKLKTHNEGDIGLFDKLVPAISSIEKVIRPPFGLSLIVVCEK